MLSARSVGFTKVLKLVEGDGKQVRYAGFRAANETVNQALKAEQKELNRAFDRPTPFIKKSLRAEYISKQTKNTPGAPMRVAVGFKDVFGKSGTAVEDTLLPHIEGGPRKPKGAEKTLRRAGILGGNEFLVPSRTAPLDRYGNIRRGVMGKILADLNAHTSAGYTSNRKAGAKRQYIVGQAGPNGTRGIYKVQRGFTSADGATGRWHLIFLIVKGAPRYKKRLRFYAVGNSVFTKNYPRNFDMWLKIALETAR